MKLLLTIILSVFLPICANSQSAEQLVKLVKAKLERVDDYAADAKLKTNVSFIKAPIANIKIYFKKPDKLQIINKNGISFIPKGSMNINLSNIFVNTREFDIIDAGKDQSTGLRVVKLLPRDDTSEVVLSTLYIDEKNFLIRKSKTTTKENGTYQLEMNYGKYSDYGLPDRIIFSFNTKEYKLPKGVTLDYDNGAKKKEDSLKNKKGTVEINYTSYIINRGAGNVNSIR
jgi:outer membrane lipoprotein-sorting protein